MEKQNNKINVVPHCLENKLQVDVLSYKTHKEEKQNIKINFVTHCLENKIKINVLV